jgi:hypothetical protein
MPAKNVYDYMAQDVRKYYHDGYYDTERTISGGIDMITGEWHPVATGGNVTTPPRLKPDKYLSRHYRMLQQRKNRNV